MAFRRRNYELEADLYKVPMPWLFKREMGELERTSYEDGEERLKISFRGVKIPEGAIAEVAIDGTVVAELAVAGGRARQILTTTENHSVPEVKDGQKVEIRFQGAALLAGVFKYD